MHFYPVRRTYVRLCAPFWGFCARSARKFFENKGILSEFFWFWGKSIIFGRFSAKGAHMCAFVRVARGNAQLGVRRAHISPPPFGRTSHHPEIINRRQNFLKSRVTYALVDLFVSHITRLSHVTFCLFREFVSHVTRLSRVTLTPISQQEITITPVSQSLPPFSFLL